MTHPYLPHTPADIRRMLDAAGAADLGSLYADVPEELRLKHPYDLPGPMTEEEVRDFFDSLASENRVTPCFCGMGWYDHYTPAVIPALAQRSEFLTSYTPYQPEVSQGTLHYIFEYQTIMCELTGLDVSNASMYDGSTALAEAMLMCVAATRKRRRVLASATLNPVYLKVMSTYAHFHGVELEIVEATEDGLTDVAAMGRLIDERGDVAGVIVQTPNLYGCLEHYTGLAEKVHSAKALLVVSTPASALAVLRSPAEWGADIAAGEAQSLGMPMGFGGPGLGYICSTKALMRKLPGRIVGATTDRRGQRCFVLTLQAREQHIRRDKATSNICSNQGLMTLWATMYVGLMGLEGLREVNRAGCDGAHALAAALCETGVFEPAFPGTPFLNEFTLRYKGEKPMDDFLSGFTEFSPGVRVDEDLLVVAVTERNTPAQIERYVETAKQAAL